MKMCNGGLAMHIKKITAAPARMVAILVVILSVGLLTPPADGHHSYAMYDGSVYRVFTGVIVRVIPNAAHFEFHFVPLNEKRDALVRDEKGEPLVTRSEEHTPELQSPCNLVCRLL